MQSRARMQREPPLVDCESQPGDFLLGACVVQNRFDVQYGRAIDRFEVIDFQSTFFGCEHLHSVKSHRIRSVG